jgi:hypothetical protein
MIFNEGKYVARVVVCIKILSHYLHGVTSSTTTISGLLVTWPRFELDTS